MEIGLHAIKSVIQGRLFF